MCIRDRVYISFIIEVEEKSKKVMLMYLITYITNVLNIVPTIQSYGIDVYKRQQTYLLYEYGKQRNEP